MEHEATTCKECGRAVYVSDVDADGKCIVCAPKSAAGKAAKKEADKIAAKAAATPWTPTPEVNPLHPQSTVKGRVATDTTTKKK